jgi:hypothetical protein
MLRYILTVLAGAFVSLCLCSGYASAGLLLGNLLYENHFNDLTGITVSGKDAGDLVEISSDRSVDAGGTSLKFTDVKQPKAVISSGVTDTTTTWIASMYITGDYNDHANFSVGDSAANFGGYCLRGYPTAGNLGAWNGGLPDTGVAYPHDQWVTIGMVINGPAGTYDLYFAPGTTLTNSNLVLSGATMRNEASVWDCLSVASGNSVLTGPMYLDELRVFDATPEPSAIVLLVTGLLGIVCYAWRKRK